MSDQHSIRFIRAPQGNRRGAGQGLVSAAVCAVLCGTGPAALAQQAESPARADTLEELLVTGSRVIREGMSSPSPVTAINTDELLQYNPQSISQALAVLPSMTGSTTPTTIGGRSTVGVGSFLNLRNLGTNRNLVLLDGRRVVPSNIAGNTDINLLPQGLISNVSVVTGGASAAYGSDAVAGVSNFILNTRFEGFNVDLNGGFSDHGRDAESFRLATAAGGSLLDGRLHLIGSFDWRDSRQAYKENRPWANRNCGVLPVPGVTPQTMSPDNPRQTIVCGVTQPVASYGGAITTGPLVTPNEGITFGEGGVPEAFTYGTLRSGNLQAGGEGNFVGDTQNFSTPTDNKVAFGHALYEISDNIEGFVQVTLGRADSTYAQTPAYFFGPARGPTIYSGNPFIPATIQGRMDELEVDDFRLNIVPRDWGNIAMDSNYRARDFVTGLRGRAGSTGNWDVYYQNGRTSFRLDYIDQVSMSRLYRALDAVVAPNGAVVCQSALDNPAAYGDCVPLNPFGEGSASQAALDYIRPPGSQPWNLNVMRQQTAGANFNAEPFATWAGPVGLGTGVEWRRLEGEIDSDAGSHTVPDQDGIRGMPPSITGRVGDWSTSNVLPTSGSYNVKEAFVEVLVPLARDRTVMSEVDFNAAFRYTDYSQSGSVDTWKMGLTWRPMDDVLLRGTRSRDIRAPGIGDLFTGDSSGPSIIVNYGGTSVSVPILLAGNPGLVPEEADTTTFGIVWEPSQVEGLGVSVDYYDIKITDVLASVGGQETVNRCEAGFQMFCENLILSGDNLVGVRLRTMNLNEARTRGIDVEMSYRTSAFGLPTSFRLIANRLLEQSTTVPTLDDAVYVDRVGDAGLGYSKLRLNASTNVDVGAFAFNVNARYIDGGPYNTTFLPGDIAPEYERVGSYTTFSVGGRYHLQSVRGEPELYLNVANVLDRDPPLIPSTALVGFQTNVGIYDTIGRYFTAGVRLTF